MEFYLIPDHIPNPEWPRQKNLRFAGGLELKEFEQMQKLGLIEPECGYFDDFRWNFENVKSKHETINSKFRLKSIENNVVNKFAVIIDLAFKQKVGITAYCD
jgi:hypothetical protein